MITFGMRLKELRDRENLTQEEFRNKFNSFSDKVKISRQSLSSWERGDRFPDEVTINELALYLNVSKGYIMGDNVNYSKTDISNYNFFAEMLEKMIERGIFNEDNISESDWKILAEVLKADIRRKKEGKK